MENARPKISVIIPSYNSGKTIEKCVGSILSQSFQDFEIIIIDDGSTDASPMLCDRLAENDSRITVRHKKNGGISSARNMGLELVRGEWVTFMDSDDEYRSDHLGNAAERFSEDIGLVVLGFKEVSLEGETLYETHVQGPETADAAFLLKEMYMPAIAKCQGYVTSKIFRTEVIRREHLRFDESIFFNEDRLFCVEYVCKMHKPAALFLAPTYKYNINPDSAIGKLKTCYNRKYVTDHTACVKMRRKVLASPYRKAAGEFTKYGVFKSYVMNLDFMSRCGIKDECLHYLLLARTVASIGPVSFLRIKKHRNEYTY